MDVYHKILVKIYEQTEGRETVDVDLIDLLKREGFFPSLNVIASQLSDEGWVTETTRKHVVRITHWGKAEARKSMSNAPDTKAEALKEAGKLVTITKEFLVMLEELAGSPSAEKMQAVEDKYGMIGPALKKLKSNVG